MHKNKHHLMIMARPIPKLGFLRAPSLLILASSYLCTMMEFTDGSDGFTSPLYTDSRWIVDRNGNRVKLACVNWPSHLQPVLAEGLHKQPVDAIINRVKLMGFNCVRFTWPTELAINNTLASTTVRESFQRLGLIQALSGIEMHNPRMLDLTLMDAFKAVLTSFERKHMMIVLDNHITIPGWCCGLNDGNGFFGDANFDPKLWMQGLRNMATLASKFSCVIGMSLRNELRGHRSNVNDWYKYMQEGSETVHAANNNVLVIVSGLNYDKDLSFLRNRTLDLSFERKLVFEMHWYSFSQRGAWGNNMNDACGWVGTEMMNAVGFLAEQGRYPVFVSEFGADGRGTNVADNRFISCFMAYAAGQDWDFAVWSLQGSYYLREGVVELEEAYGLLDLQWSGIRNPNLLRRYSAIQSPFRGPGGRKPVISHKIIFHPLTGLCIERGTRQPLHLGSCELAQSWMYTSEKKLRLTDSPFFLEATEPKRLTTLTFSPFGEVGSSWDTLSISKLHLSSRTGNGTTVCLDVDQYNQVVSNNCWCLTRDNRCDPSSQWFKIIDSTFE